LAKLRSWRQGDLAGVQRDGEDLALGDARLDAAAHEPRIQRVVAGVEAQVRVRRTRSTHRRSVSGAVAGKGAITERSSRSRSIGRQRSILCTRGFARVSNQSSICSWKSSSLAKDRPGFEGALKEILQALDTALGLRVARLAEVPADLSTPQKAANSAGGRPPPA
jgi:hypothetical protein